MSISDSPVVLAGRRLDVVSSGCNDYYFSRLEELTGTLPTPLSAPQQLLPKEVSTVAQFLHSTSKLVMLSHG